MSQGISTPKINSLTLANTLKKVKPQLENFKQQLDNLTADIKEVENFIKSTGLAQTFDLAVVWWNRDPEAYLKQDPVDFGEYQDELSWRKSEDSKTFRLFHTLYKVTDRGDWTEDPVIIFSKPLLESSVNTRKRVFPYLNNFLEELSDAIAVKDLPKKNPFEADNDIPF